MEASTAVLGGEFGLGALMAAVSGPPGGEHNLAKITEEVVNEVEICKEKANTAESGSLLHNFNGLMEPSEPEIFYELSATVNIYPEYLLTHNTVMRMVYGIGDGGNGILTMTQLRFAI